MEKFMVNGQQEYSIQYTIHVILFICVLPSFSLLWTAPIRHLCVLLCSMLPFSFRSTTDATYSVPTSLLICKINNFAFDFNSPEQYMHRYSEQKQNQIILLWVVYCMQKKHQDCVLNCVSDPFSTHQNKHMKSVNYKLIVCAPRIFVLNCQPHTHYNIFLHSSSNFSLPPILFSLCLFVSFGPLLWCSLLLPFAFPFFLSFSRCSTTYLRFWPNFPIYAYVSRGYPNIEYIVTRSIQMQIAFTHNMIRIQYFVFARTRPFYSFIRSVLVAIEFTATTITVQLQHSNNSLSFHAMINCEFSLFFCYARWNTFISLFTEKKLARAIIME